MKKTLISILLATGALLPAAAFADAQVQVFPTITNAHGGARFAAQLSTTITYNGRTQSESSVPTYDLGAGPVDYTVTADSYAGYSATLDSNCAGTAQEGQTVVCNIDWQDGAPVASTPAPQPSAAAPSSSLPATPSGTTIVIPDAQTTSNAAATTDEQAQIAALQAEIIDLLKQLVVLLQAKLAAQQAGI